MGITHFLKGEMITPADLGTRALIKIKDLQINQQMKIIGMY